MAVYLKGAFMKANYFFKWVTAVACISITWLYSPLYANAERPNFGWSWIMPYQPNYILPYYYTQSPDQNFRSVNPSGTRIQNNEFKFQISIQVPIVEDVFFPKDGINLAYTQLSYWQAYDQSAFFRETNYEPELFYHVNDLYKLGSMHLKHLQLGFVHQSNGRGGQLERSWNRIYLDQTLSWNQLNLSIRPWWRIHMSGLKDYNSDIMNYLGYGRVVIWTTLGQAEWSIMLRNQLESAFKRGFEQISISYPFTQHVKGYIQLNSGYGQSLAEYNHYTNAFGVGISLSGR